MVAPLKAARENAIRTHVYRVNVRHLATDDLPFGPIHAISDWCIANIGPRWVGWCYIGAGIWAFDDPDNAAWFLFIWRCYCACSK